MSARVKPPAKSPPERTARQIADMMLDWHDDFAAQAGDPEPTADDHERRAAAAKANAERCAMDALTSHPDMSLTLLSVAGRYANAARIGYARAKELRR